MLRQPPTLHARGCYLSLVRSFGELGSLTSVQLSHCTETRAHGKKVASLRTSGRIVRELGSRCSPQRASAARSPSRSWPWSRSIPPPGGAFREHRRGALPPWAPAV